LLLGAGRDWTLALIGLGFRCRGGGHAWSWSFVYLAVRKVLALIMLVGRSDRSKELEILVLRHELAVLRRRSGRPGFEPADRALLAALSQALPRRVGSVLGQARDIAALAPSTWRGAERIRTASRDGRRSLGRGGT
jgi:hypothetical protein